jgi:hypothetical protein
MCPGRAGIIIIIGLFLVFLVHTATATKKLELQKHYELKQIPVFTNRIERLSVQEMTDLDTEIEASDKYKVTLIGAVHGNEPVGYYALTEMIENNELVKYYDKTDFYIFTDPNEHGRKNNKRNSPWGDLNRLWPKEYGPMDGLAYPVKVMMPFIHKVDLVVDIHEAFGYNRCQKSLGNTMYISDPSKKAILQPIIDELNNKLRNEWDHGAAPCDQWDILTELPKTLNTLGTLDEYVAAIPKERRPFYILLEVPGQKDVQELDKRMRTTKFLLHNIISTLTNLV